MNNYLKHYGILGMKWGVRRYENPDGTLTEAGKKRYSNKEMRADRESYREKLENEHPLTKKMEAYENKAYALAGKYDFDGDDGGGGRTAADRRAGQQYVKYFDKIQELEAVRDQEVNAKVTKYMLDKYGKTRVNQLNTAECAKYVALGAAAVPFIAGAMVASTVVIPAAIIGATGYVVVQNAKNKKEERDNKEDKEKK